VSATYNGYLLDVQRINYLSIHINPFDVYVEYTRHEKVIFFLFNVDYTHHVVKNFAFVIKVKFR